MATKNTTTTPAKPATTLRPASGGAKASNHPATPKAATPANDGATVTEPKPKGKAAPKEAKPKRLSALDAAAQVLADNGGEMSART